MIKLNLKVAPAFLALILFVSSSPIEKSLEAGDCFVTSFSQIDNAVSKCTNIVINGITVPAGRTLTLNLMTGTTVTFKGTTKFQFKQWKGPLVEVKGCRVTVIGDSGSALDGQGPLYWDGLGDKGCLKAKFFKIKTTGGSVFKNIKLLNCPKQCVSINGASDTLLTGWDIDVSLGDSKGGHNTDGFDLSNSNRITIENTVVKNQDDCVAVNQGSNYLFRGLTCSGGHGLSLSVGQTPANGEPNTVRNVTFTDCNVKNSRNGIHVKTHADAGIGSISSVTYRNIKMSGITHYAINIQEDYVGGKSTGKPKSNIPITGLNFESVTGSMSTRTNAMAVYILCGSSGCKNWKWTGVAIASGGMKNICNFTPTGFKC